MEKRLYKNFATSAFIAALWVSSIVLETGGQLALKQAADMTLSTATGSQWFLQLMWQPWFSLAVFFDISNFLVWMMILRQHDLSLAVPLSSLSYFPIVLTGTLVFNEPVSIVQAIGLLTIAAGIWLVTTEPSSSV